MSARFTLTRESPTRLSASGRIDVANAAGTLEHCRRSLGAQAAATTVDLGALASSDSVTWPDSWHGLHARVNPVALEFVAMSPRLRALAHLSDVDSLPGLRIDG